MSNLSAHEEAVGRHYDQAILSYEQERLPAQSAVEYGVTARYLLRCIDPGATVAEVGVGGGYYTVLLAQRDCSLYLADVAQQLLTIAEGRVHAAGLGEHILDSRRASATALSHLGDTSCDAVLLLGPLYHLCDPADRRRAVSEAARVLKPGGLLFAAGINRLAYLRDAFRDASAHDPDRIVFRAQFLQDGNLDPEHAPPLGYAHLTTSAEFRDLFKDAFAEVELVGVDSFAGVWQASLPRLPEAEREAWLDVVEQTGRTPDGIGQSDHFLFIGRKRA